MNNVVHDVYYHDARTGRRLAQCDLGSRRVGLKFRAPFGEIAHCIPKDGTGAYYVDEHGQVVEPAWLNPNTNEE